MKDVSGEQRSKSAPWQNRLTIANLSNVIKRVIFGIVMFSGAAATIIMGGPVALILAVLMLQIACFKEVISIGYNYNQIPTSRLPYFRPLGWYFLLVANYFFFGEIVSPRIEFIKTSHLGRFMGTYHRFVSFCLYFAGLMVFVLTLVKKYDMKQFRILGWTHFLLMIIVLQSYLVIDNLFHGLIWCVLPGGLVVINDIFAYIFGRTMGKTPLIKLSPNKTWEGFIGGIFGTFVAGFFLSNAMCKYQHFICPNEYYQNDMGFAANCTPSYLFTPAEFNIGFISITYYPFFKHFVAFSLFASLLAPFGGFCASGFKRACKIKDFSDTIPGHGGIMDRTDCQFLMVTFVNVYIFTFVRVARHDLLFEKILYLREQDQLQFYYMLKEALEMKHLALT